MDLKNSAVNLAKANNKIILFVLQLKLEAIYKASSKSMGVYTTFVALQSQRNLVTGEYYKTTNRLIRIE